MLNYYFNQLTNNYVENKHKDYFFENIKMLMTNYLILIFELIKT